MTYVVARESKKGDSTWTVETQDAGVTVIAADLVAGGADPDQARMAAEMLFNDSPPLTKTVLGSTYIIEKIERLAYPVELSRDDNGTVLVRIPDVPGAITFGESEKHALEHAVDALETMLLAHMLDRKRIPVPSPARGRPTIHPTLLGTLKVMLYEAMRERDWRKADLARALGLNPRQIDRLLDLRHASTVKQLEQALAACGKRADVSARELEAA